jgi:hypothetical protein
MTSDRYTLATGVSSVGFSGSRDRVMAYAKKLSETAAGEIEVRDDHDVIARFRLGVAVQGPKTPRPAAAARSVPGAGVTKAAPKPSAAPIRWCVARTGKVVATGATESDALEKAMVESETHRGFVVTAYDGRGKIVRSFLDGARYQGPPTEPVPPEWVDMGKPAKRKS